MTMTSLNPTDVVDNETVSLEYTVSNARFITPTSKALLKAELILSAYLVHSLNASDFKFVHPNGGSWTPDYVYKSSNTVYAGFTGVPPIDLEGADLIIKINGNCASLTANYDLSYRLNLNYNPDTTCSSSCFFPVYCKSDKIRIHCQTNCNAGLHFNDFDAYRISYGEPDNNNDGKPDASGNIDLDKIKTKRIMYGDTLFTVFRGRVYGSGSTNFWSFCKAESKLNYGRYLSVADVRIKIYRYGSLIYDCDQIGYSQSTSGSSRTFSFDLSYANLANSGCNVYTNFRYTSVDSVEVEVKYIVDENIGNNVVDLAFTNSIYVSNVSNPSASQKYSCDNFSAKVNLVGYYFTNYGKGTYNLQGCNNATTTQNFYLSVGNCCTNYAGGNLFPYEYRSWAKLHKIVLVLPTGYEFSSSRLYQYRTAGTNITSYDYVSSLTPDTIIDNKVAFNASSLYTDAGGDVTLSDDGFYGVFYATYKAGCQVPEGNSTIRYNFIFEKLNYMGSGYDTLFSDVQSDVVNYSRPTINLIPQSTYVYASTDTVEWQVRISNSSTTTWMDNVWLGASQAGNVQLIEVVNKRTGKVYTPDKDIFKLGPFGASAQEDYIIRAVYTSCSIDSLQLKMGFDCIDYPDSLGAYPCKTADVNLVYEPLNTTLEAGLIDTITPVNLCAENTYEIFVRNAANPVVYGTYLDLLLRPGMILNDSAWLFIKGRSDSTLITNPQSLPGNTWRWNLADQDSTLKNTGLLGVQSADGNEILLKVKMNTNCNFVSGSYFLIKPGGSLKCGEPVNAAFAVGEPIDIIGVTRPYYSASSLNFSPLEICDFQDSAVVKFINLGPDSTGSNDLMVLSLPQGIYVDTNYISSGHNAPPTYPVYSPANGENVYEWNIPQGIEPGDSMIFDIRPYFDGPAVSCGYKQIYAQAVVSQPVLCVKDSSYCNIRVATSSTQVTDSLKKSNYSMNFVSASSVLVSGVEDINLNYGIRNSGVDKNSPIRVKVVYDVNLDGVYDSTDQVIAVDTVNDPIIRGQLLNRSFRFMTPPSKVCDLYLLIDDSNCNCTVDWQKIDHVQLRNAGKDSTVCPLEPAILGLSGSNEISYSWTDAQYLTNSDSAIATFSKSNISSQIDTNVFVLTSDRGRCQSKDTSMIMVFPGMQSALSDSALICSGDQILVEVDVMFGPGEPLNYVWSRSDSVDVDLGDSIYISPRVSQQYNLVIEDQNNCTIKDSVFVQVSETPLAGIKLKDSCEGLEFIIEDISNYFSSSADSIHWRIGQDDYFNQGQVSLTIDSAQKIKVSLYIENAANACWDTASEVLTVHPNPDLEIKAYNDCAFDTTTIWDLSSIESGFMNTAWLIEGDSFFGNRLSYQTNNSGPLNIALYAISDNNCFAFEQRGIQLWSKPEILLEDQESCLNDSFSVDFSLAQLALDSIRSNYWTNNGMLLDSIGDLRHQFGAEGDYTIQLEVVSNHLCRDTAEMVQTIHPNPVAGISLNDVCLGDTTFLNDQSTIGSGRVRDYWWDLGAGWNLLDSSLFTIYSQSGSKEVKLKVRSDMGCYDSTSSIAAVHFVPEPGIQVDGNCEDETIGIGLILTEIDSINAVTWTLESSNYFSNNFNYYFGSSGQKQINLKLQTNRACEVDTTFTFTIDPAPVADIQYSLPCEDKQVLFVGPNLNCSWDLGDGNSSNLDSFVHTYQQAGTYTVQLVVVNGFGCDDTGSMDITTGNEVLTEVLLKDICARDSQWIDHNTTGNTAAVSAARYSMGNGDTVQNINPFQYAYPNPGIYTVNLRITTLPGCIYAASKDITVHQVPKADFYFNPLTTTVLNPEIQVYDQSSFSDSVRYSISDGGAYGSRDFSHTFGDSGRYLITQYVQTDFGCSDSISMDYYVSYVYHLYIPNAFSPNSDNTNDAFRPKGIGAARYEMQIYNRWGQLIWESDDASAGWNGEDAMQGYYMYIIKVYDYEGEPHIYSGVVYLIK